ncbi:MAG: AEC family transporter [Candidatus Competibacteraceae bacterium]|jgi:predicted permease|nr:AEC family transporter [Candidatus Competibacteraceae bacterium]
MSIAENGAIIVGALGPIFSLILLGYGLKVYRFPGEAFWPAAEKLTYFLLLPALLVNKLALAELGNYAIGPFAGVIVLGLGLATLILFLLRPLIGVDGPAFSSIYQGGIRFNTYVGLAAASALFHTPGSTLAALAMAVLIPLINVLCVGVLTHATGATGTLHVMGQLLRNPLLLACVLGILLNVSGLRLPLGSAAVLDILARAALPLGLLAVGAGLQISGTLPQMRALLVSSAFKLLIMPTLFGGLAWVVGVNDLELAILVLFAALPGATSAYILARQLGGDAPLMAAIVTVETAASMVTLPVILLLLV